MNDYVSKPVQFEDLVRALSQSQPLDQASDSMHAARATALPPAVNRNVLNELRTINGDAGRTVLYEIIDLFLSDTPQQLAEPDKAAARGDAHGVHYAAHTLKSSSAILGATGLSRLCQELETMAQAGQMAGATAHLTRVEEEYARVKLSLEAVRDETGNSQLAVSIQPGDRRQVTPDVV